MERDSEEFSTAMYYARAILSFSLITLFFKDVWATLMKTLGVGTDVYEKDQEEKARINAIEENKKEKQRRNEQRWLNAFEKQRYNKWLREHR